MNATLYNAVTERLGEDFETDLEDVANHGANSGFTGFIYTRETCGFFADNRDMIVKHVRDMAEYLGEDSVSFVAGFRCLTDDFETREAVASVLYDRTWPNRWNSDNSDDVTDDECSVANALAWFTLEEAAQEYADNN